MGICLQERIKAISEYHPDIICRDGHFVLKVVYRNKWSVIEPEDGERIVFSKDDNIANMYWYVASIDDVDELFDLIDMTIEVNKEMEKKTALYNEKVKELQDLFLSDETYENLKNLEFRIVQKKQKPSKKQKVVQPQDNDVTDTTVTGVENVTSVVTPDVVTVEPTDNVTSNNEIDEKIKQALGDE